MLAKILLTLWVTGVITAMTGIFLKEHSWKVSLVGFGLMIVTLLISIFTSEWF